MDFDFITFKMFQWNDWDMPYLNLNIVYLNMRGPLL